MSEFLYAAIFAAPAAYIFRPYLWKCFSLVNQSVGGIGRCLWRIFSGRCISAAEDMKHEIVGDNISTELEWCSVCRDEFILPCQANCTHWFCGECILRVWEYGSALTPCKCPICRQPITLLIPTQLNTVNTHNSHKVVSVLRDIAAYNQAFDGRIITLIQRWFHWLVCQMEYPQREIRFVHRAYFIFFVILLLYLLLTVDLMLDGKVLGRVFV